MLSNFLQSNNMTVFDLGSFKTSAEKVLNNAIVCDLL